MLIKSVAALVLAGASFASGTPSHHATPGLTAGAAMAAAASESSPWFDTNSNAAGSRSNPTEKLLSPSSVTNVGYRRSVVSPVISPKATCTDDVVAPLLAGGDLYAMTNGELSKYDAATGNLIWRSIPDPAFTNIYKSLAISANLVIVGGSDCTSASEPPGLVFAYNATTGALAWKTSLFGAGPLDDATIAQSFVVTEGADAAGSEVEVMNLSNGKLVWSHFGCGGFTPAEVVGGIVMSNGCGSGASASLDANNLATGKLLWTLDGNWFIQRGDLSGAAGKHLFATNPSNFVVGLDPATGHKQYTLSQAGNVLAVDSSRVYAVCGQDVCAYNTTTGAREWDNSTLIDAPALAAEANGVLYLDFGAALNAATGKLITKAWTPFNFNTPPTGLAVGDGRIAVVSDPRVLDLFGLPGS